MFWLYIYVGTCSCSTFRLCRSPWAKSTSNHADKEENKKQATGGPPVISQEYDLLLIWHRIVLIMVWSFELSTFLFGIRQVWDTELSWYSLIIFFVLLVVLFIDWECTWFYECSSVFNRGPCLIFNILIQTSIRLWLWRLRRLVWQKGIERT